MPVGGTLERAMPDLAGLPPAGDDDRERQRIDDLLRITDLVALRDGVALDVGARDGRFSRHLLGRFARVVALDLERPGIDVPGIECVQGDVTRLALADDSFDFVSCTEVLEHIPAQRLADACAELRRVTRDSLLIGVPFEQDTRVGRTTCASCRRPNPPWGHVNSFSMSRLTSLFSGMEVVEQSFVGCTRERTNGLSTALMDLAGNPWGTYGQAESCVHCGGTLAAPAPGTILSKVVTRAAFWCRRPSEWFSPPRALWIHLLLRKRSGPRPAP